MEAKRTLLTKRQQISASSKAVFIWVAIASVVVSFSVVASIFLGKQLVFNEKVLAAKAQTASNLTKDINTAQALKDNVNLLLSNAALSTSKAQANDSNLQVVFDALPTTYDSSALGASLQQVLLGNGTVGSIQDLSVTSATDTSSGSSPPSTSASGPQEIDFSFTVSGTAAQIQAMLTRLESSIRPIQVTSLTINGGTTSLSAAVEAKTYYQPAVDLEVTTKKVTPTSQDSK